MALFIILREKRNVALIKKIADLIRKWNYKIYMLSSFFD